MLARDLLQRLDRLALGLGQLLRDGDAHAREQVALAAALQLGGPLPLQLQQLARLGAGWNLDREPFAVRRRHLDLRPQCRLRIRDRDVDDEIGRAAPLEQLRRRNARHHEEVARWPAVETGLALALQPDARAVLDAGGDLDRVALRALLATGSVAARARVLDDRPVPAAARARL